MPPGPPPWLLAILSSAARRESPSDELTEECGADEARTSTGSRVAAAGNRGGRGDAQQNASTAMPFLSLSLSLARSLAASLACCARVSPSLSPSLSFSLVLVCSQGASGQRAGGRGAAHRSERTQQSRRGSARHDGGTMTSARTRRGRGWRCAAGGARGQGDPHGCLTGSIVTGAETVPASPTSRSWASSSASAGPPAAAAVRSRRRGRR